MELLANETLTNRKKHLKILICNIQWCVWIQLFLKFLGVKTLENRGKEMKVILSIANFNDGICVLYIDNQMHWSSHQSSGCGNNEIHLQMNNFFLSLVDSNILKHYKTIDNLTSNSINWHWGSEFIT
jgi:hypothetical protein